MKRVKKPFLSGVVVQEWLTDGLMPISFEVYLPLYS